ncbi:MAG: cobalamin biosynthesis protein [Oscillospiraceae bacterium]|nr:cobalamin biosynthesis protein [Oscillospiraceae bacterium]
MSETIALAAFTERGRELARCLAERLGATVRMDESLADWTAENFRTREALIFVGAAGIAVRSIAPYIQSKAEDPAVLCVDETGRWVIPILSGHLGGANALARRLAALTGGEAVITTATDLNGLFAVDLWAKAQNMAVLQPERIKNVSAKILRGETITIDCPFPITGTAPEHVCLGSPGDVLASYRADKTDALQLVPRVLTLGVGCRRGTGADTLAAALDAFCTERGICPEAIESAASIDLKRDEAGLLSFCESHGWPLRFYAADKLRGTPGDFTASAFVEATTGVDNVCERSAVLASGGRLIEKKYARNGVTFALAEHYVNYNWSCDNG